tara:strand:+ start:2179 stop:2385 length:207 start_codon:yes stop_codon:yes gene_type:complete
MKLKVENETLVRDTSTGAILETDVGKLNKYRALRRSLRARSESIDALIERINKLEQSLEEITNGNVNL